MIDFPTATSLSSELILGPSSLNKSSAATFCCVLLSLLVSAQLPELSYNILMLLALVCCWWWWWSGMRGRLQSLTSL